MRLERQEVPILCDRLVSHCEFQGKDYNSDNMNYKLVVKTGEMAFEVILV